MVDTVSKLHEQEIPLSTTSDGKLETQTFGTRWKLWDIKITANAQSMFYSSLITFKLNLDTVQLFGKNHPENCNRLQLCTFMIYAMNLLLTIISRV